MKRLTVLLIVWMSCWAVVCAQRGLSVGGLFDGRIIPKERMVETKVRGKMLSKYRLSLFRSVRFTVSLHELAEVTELVGSDAKSAVSSERMENKERGTTLMLQMAPVAGQNRYVCMKTAIDGGRVAVMVIYMEGKIESLDDLRKIINK